MLPVYEIEEIEMREDSDGELLQVSPEVNTRLEALASLRRCTKSEVATELIQIGLKITQARDRYAVWARRGDGR